VTIDVGSSGKIVTGTRITFVGTNVAIDVGGATVSDFLKWNVDGISVVYTGTTDVGKWIVYDGTHVQYPGDVG